MQLLVSVATAAEARAALAWLAERPSATIAEVAQTAEPGRRNFVARGLLWLARYGLIVIEPAG